LDSATRDGRSADFIGGARCRRRARRSQFGRRSSGFLL